MNAEINTSQTAFSTSKKMFSLSMLEEMDDDAYVIDMLLILVTEIPQDLQKMLEAADASDYITVCKKAHILKGTAGIIQADTFVQMLTSIERDAKEQKGGICLVNQIQNAIELFSYIESELKVCIAKLQ